LTFSADGAGNIEKMLKIDGLLEQNIAALSAERRPEHNRYRYSANDSWARPKSEDDN
jgi:hypothetical protein